MIWKQENFQIKSIKNLFNDINLIFDSVSGEKYTTKDLSIRDYPDPSSGYLDDLNRNDKVTLLGYNHRGYYKIKYNNIEGFIHEDYLSDEKTIGITVPAHFTAYISRAFNIGINTRHSIWKIEKTINGTHCTHCKSSFISILF